MKRVFRFRSDLGVVPLDGERVFLVGERETFFLRGALYARLAPLIDGERSVGALIAALGSIASAPEVYLAVSTLEEKGYLVAEAGSPRSGAAAYWDALGLGAASAAERLALTPVAVRAVNGQATEPLEIALASAGITVRDDAALCVLVTDDYLSAALEAHNHAALRQNSRFLLVRPSGVEPWIGPMLGAEGGPCWACLASRIQGNRPVETYLRRRGAIAATPPRSSLAAGAEAVFAFAALALARWIAAGGRGEIDGSLLALDLDSLRLSAHRAVRRPQCPACGDPGLIAARAGAPITLEPRPKRFTDDGGHRVLTPEETLARYQHHVDPITGVVAELRSIEDGGHALRQVFGAVHHVCPRTEAPSLEDFHQLSSGKGRTPEQARASALCEAIERFSAVFQGDERRVRARLDELDCEAIEPAALQPFSEAQRRERPVASSGRSRDEARRAAPPPYDGRAIDWTPVWSLLHGGRRYVPTSACYLHVPAPPDEQFCHFDSNGLSAGNCIEEAILQGFFELVERDAVAVWWYNRVRRPSVDLASFGEPYLTDLEQHYRSMDVAIWVLDLTHDLGIPTFVAVAHAEGARRFWLGCGCHFDARLAVQRALTEVNQSFDRRARSPLSWSEDAFADPAYLFPDESTSPTRREDHPASVRDDLRDDVTACVERAAARGLEVLVLDVTRPDIGLSVVRVIVPGLRHFWPRFGRGRLYDVPVFMGWRERPLDELELNPVHYLF